MLPATGAEDLVALAVVAREEAHVLDDAMDLHVDLRLAGHCRRALGDALRGRLRCRDDVDLGAGEVLGHRQRNVARAGGHVDEQEVGLAPVDVGEELLERLVQHRAAPHDGALLLDHEADRHGRDTVADRRDDEAVDDRRHLLDAEHLGDGEAVDVRIENPDGEPAGGEGDGEVDRGGRLANAALAGRHAEDAGLRFGLHELRRPLGPGGVAVSGLSGVLVLDVVRLQTGPQQRTVVVGHPFDVDVAA